MKLIDAIKKSGRPFYVPDCSRDELPAFFKYLGFNTGAEIGVYKGQYTEKFCREGLKMYAIDNWRPYEFAGVIYQTQERQNAIYENAKARLSHYKDCVVIRKDSMDAVKDFKFESLDFAYIDSDHGFKGIAEDICEWYFRVKKGGIISGHDYAYTGNEIDVKENYEKFCQVGYIVDTFIKAFKIKNFYILGRTKPIYMESKNDKYLSWMFIKP